MELKGLVAGAVLLLCGASSASAAMLISEDRGGQIGAYLQTFTNVRDSGERVVIDGNCLSACTILLGIVPRERVCATPRARLGFHAAWMPDETGRPVTSPLGTQALWNIYPAHVRRLINRRGGLSRKMIYVQGRELARLVQPCGTQTRSASRNSPRRIGNAVRDASASASAGRR